MRRQGLGMMSASSLVLGFATSAATLDLARLVQDGRGRGVVGRSVAQLTADAVP